MTHEIALFSKIYIIEHKSILKLILNTFPIDFKENW